MAVTYPPTNTISTVSMALTGNTSISGNNTISGNTSISGTLTVPAILSFGANSAPAFKNNGTGIALRNTDDTTYLNFSAAGVYAYGSNSTPATNYSYFVGQPSDYGVGKPLINIFKTPTANKWGIGLWDTSNFNGQIDLQCSNLTWNNTAISTTGFTICMAMCF